MADKNQTEESMGKFLASRYSHPYEWVFLTQVRSSTGSANRIADAMAFNMYQSTGHEILGFEIKVSRSDWLSELKNMGKSNELMAYCDKWFLVVSDASIVKEGELPKGWGLLVLKGDKLVMKTRPTLQTTAPIPDHFLASILRRGANEVERIRSTYILKEDIESKIKEAERLVVFINNEIALAKQEESDNIGFLIFNLPADLKDVVPEDEYYKGFLHGVEQIKSRALSAINKLDKD